MEEVAHKKYLNDYYTGKLKGSVCRGELYNDDPRLGDARLCGTTASLCGLESAAENGDEGQISRSLQCIKMMHAFMFGLSGIPVLYSGDEIAAFNDNSYHSDPNRADDSRFLHRGRLNWEAAANRNDLDTIEGKNYTSLRELEKIRSENEVFRSDAEVTILYPDNNAVLALTRKYRHEKLLLLYNFSGSMQKAAFDLVSGYNMITAQHVNTDCIELSPYEFIWLKLNEE